MYFENQKFQAFVASQTKARTLEALLTKAATGGVLQKKVFLKISPVSQENICVGVSF